jgi:hypothetical protein
VSCLAASLLSLSCSTAESEMGPKALAGEASYEAFFHLPVITPLVAMMRRTAQRGRQASFG